MASPKHKAAMAEIYGRDIYKDDQMDLFEINERQLDLFIPDKGDHREEANNE